MVNQFKVGDLVVVKSDILITLNKYYPPVHYAEFVGPLEIIRLESTDCWFKYQKVSSLKGKEFSFAGMDLVLYQRNQQLTQDVACFCNSKDLFNFGCRCKNGAIK